MSKDTYEFVAGVVGKAMDQAFKDIMNDLATAAKGGKAQSFTLANTNTTLQASQLQEFFKLLGGAGLNLEFACREPKGRIARFSSADLDWNSDISTKAVSGSITIGIGINF